MPVMPSAPGHGDFIIEPIPESARFLVRREGISTILYREFEDYDGAIAFALDSADAKNVHAFIQDTTGWICLS